jgi:polysaccharide biosynthesis protein PelA
MNYLARSRVGLLLGMCVAPALGQLALTEREPPAGAEPKFIVYYGLRDHLALSRYDVAVLESEIDVRVLGRFDPRAQTLGYLSLGEVNMSRSWALELEHEGILLTPNPMWQDARFIDMRSPRWKRRVLEDLIPAILMRGFTGVFLDTLDNAAYLESLDKIKFAGMTEAAVNLVRGMRIKFPQLTIMANRGYEILPRIVADIDMVLGESVHSTYEVKKAAYTWVEEAAVRWQTTQLYEARRLKPELKLFSLDYWSANDSGGIAKIYAEARRNGLIPYVGTFDLTQVIPRS